MKQRGDYSQPPKSLSGWLENFEVEQEVNLGESLRAGCEPVRFTQSLSLAFPCQEVTSLSKGKMHFEIEQAILGLNGFDGPMPRDWSEVLWQEIDKEAAKRSFLDLFNHRCFLLYWKVLAHSQLLLAHRRQPSVVSYLLQNCAIRAQGSSSPGSGLDAAALWLDKQPSASSLKALLSTYLHLHVEVKEFQPIWLGLDRADQIRLGSNDFCLGHDIFLGSKVLSSTQCIVVAVGPVPWKSYMRLTQDKSLAAIFALIERYVCKELIIKLRIGVIKHAGQKTALKGAKLGVNTWLGESREMVCWDFVRSNDTTSGADHG